MATWKRGLCLHNGKPHILAGNKAVHVVEGDYYMFLMYKLVAVFLRLTPTPLQFCFKAFVSAMLKGGVKTKDFL